MRRYIFAWKGFLWNYKLRDTQALRFLPLCVLTSNHVVPTVTVTVGGSSEAFTKWGDCLRWFYASSDIVFKDVIGVYIKKLPATFCASTSNCVEMYEKQAYCQRRLHVSISDLTCISCVLVRTVKQVFLEDRRSASPKQTRRVSLENWKGRTNILLSL